MEVLLYFKAILRRSYGGVNIIGYPHNNAFKYNNTRTNAPYVQLRFIRRHFPGIPFSWFPLFMIAVAVFVLRCVSQMR